MDINSDKIIIIKPIVGFMIKKQQNAIQKLLFIFSTKTYGLGTVIPVAITAIYLSKQGVSDLGYTQAHVSFRL